MTANGFSGKSGAKRDVRHPPFAAAAAAAEDGLGERGDEPEGLFAPPKGGFFYAVVTERVLAHRLQGLKSDRVAISQIYTRLQRRHCNDHEKGQDRYGICKGKVPTFV